MYGIVTIIEGEAGRQVHALWQQWREQFGDQAVQGMSVPHVSYHVAADYDLDAVAGAVSSQLARVSPGFV